MCTQDNSWNDLDPEDLSTVYVLDDTGQETTGELLRLDADGLVLLVEGAELRFEAEQAIRLDRRGDSLKNGLLIGAAIGAVLGLVSDAGPLLGAVGFAGIGLGIDALNQGRITLYDASGGPRSGLLHQGQYPSVATVKLTLKW